MGTRVHTVTKAQSENTDEDLISSGFHKVTRNAAVPQLSGIPEITGAYLNFELYKETK
jgi:hypothetical protein